MNKQIETERLRLRPIKLSDNAFMLELLNTPGWLQYIGDRHVHNLADAEAHIERIINRQHFYYYVFELKATAEPMGIVTFLYREEYSYPDIGFAMLPRFEQQGYAFEASNSYMLEMIKDKQPQKVIAITLPDNIHSIKLLEKLGLRYEAEVADETSVLHLYSINLSND